LDFGNYIARIYPPKDHHGWSFTSEWRLFKKEDEAHYLDARRWPPRFDPDERREIAIERGVRAALQSHFGRPGPCELNVWKIADYTDLEKAEGVEIEFDHLSGMSLVNTGRRSSEFGKLPLKHGEPSRTALIRVRHGHDASWVERTEGDIDLLSVLLSAIRIRSIVRPAMRAAPVDKSASEEDVSHDAE